MVELSGFFRSFLGRLCLSFIVLEDEQAAGLSGNSCFSIPYNWQLSASFDNMTMNFHTMFSNCSSFEIRQSISRFRSGECRRLTSRWIFFSDFYPKKHHIQRFRDSQNTPHRNGWLGHPHFGCVMASKILEACPQWQMDIPLKHSIF